MLTSSCGEDCYPEERIANKSMKRVMATKPHFISKESGKGITTNIVLMNNPVMGLWCVKTSHTDFSNIYDMQGNA